MSDIVFVSSQGGHRVQLEIIVNAMKADGHVVTLVTSSGGDYLIPDFNKSTPIKLILSLFCIAKIVFLIRPTHVVSTGAAPGLCFAFLSKCLGARVLWIDSVANAQRLSLSGRLACRFCDQVLTQWPDLVSERVAYRGRLV